MTRTTTEFWLMLIGCGMLGIAALGAYGAVRTAIIAGRSARWPSVPGTIVTSTLHSYAETGHRKRDVTLYGAEIRYTYQVGRERYESDMVGWGGGVDGNDPDPAERVVERYPVGKRVRVHYDPKHPATAVLEPASREGLLVLAIVAAGTALVGSILIAAPYLRLLKS